MRDRLSKERRSWNMSRIRGKDTSPEKRVRSQLHRMGFRFRLHRKDLPGNPDIVLPRLRKIVLVHGCFWHGHECGKSMPKSNVEFWTAKLDGNIRRDIKNARLLRAVGWKVLIIWECELRD